ncbi:hypothetical protein GQ600_15753 [Phytophthora cactorum]|nr:hypothetical protein GQ600_15753 [Phytophthora cactorum]
MEVLLLTRIAVRHLQSTQRKLPRKCPCFAWLMRRGTGPAPGAAKSSPPVCASETQKQSVPVRPERSAKTHGGHEDTSSIHRCRRCGKALSMLLGSAITWRKPPLRRTAVCWPSKAATTGTIEEKRQYHQDPQVSGPLQDLRMHLADRVRLSTRNPCYLTKAGKNFKSLQIRQGTTSQDIADEYLSMLKNKQRQPTQKPLVIGPRFSCNNSKATIAGSTRC